jgi:uncharacterized membrane protein YgdD (TMEM256/DUF423 family)
MRGRFLIFAGILGMIAVAFGAFGAHGLSTVLSSEALGWVETGSRYQLIHAAALLALAMAPSKIYRSARLVNAAGLALFFGAFVFGAALYLLALTGQRWLGAVAPVGGALMIVGWAVVLAAGVRSLTVQRPRRR